MEFGTNSSRRITRHNGSCHDTTARSRAVCSPTEWESIWFNRRKQDALIEFAAGAGHEINNPVAAISGRVQLLLKDEDDPKRRESLATIGAQAMRISQMIGDTMQYAEPPPLHRTQCELGTAVKTILEKLNSQLKEQGTQVKLTRPQATLISADETQLQTVIAELITNSMNALGQGGVININILPPGDSLVGFARLEVGDNGPGLSDADRRHLFDPFLFGTTGRSWTGVWIVQMLAHCDGTWWQRGSQFGSVGADGHHNILACRLITNSTATDVLRSGIVRTIHLSPPCCE